MAIPSDGQTSEPPESPRAEAGRSPAPDGGTRDAGSVPHYVYLRLVLALFAIIAGMEGYLIMQAAKSSLQVAAGYLAFLTAAVLIGTAIVFEPLRALMRRRG